MKTKTYVLTLPEYFPKGHPKEDYATHFAQRVVCGLRYAAEPDYEPKAKSKIHTIRTNYDLWKQRIDEVNAGHAVLSVRVWTGKPYHSKQREIFWFDKDSGIGVERIDMMLRTHEHHGDFDRWMFNKVGDGYINVKVDGKTLAENDGLTLDPSDNCEIFKSE